MLLLLLLPMVISDVSDASFVLKLRKLIAPDPNDAKPKVSFFLMLPCFE